MGRENLLGVHGHHVLVDPPDRRDAVLEPFVRLGSSETGSTGGGGLGLAVVRTVVDGHRGRVRIGDAPEGGALVEVLLARFREGPDSAAG
jgi:signal transduction histidine kinase